MKIEFTKKQYRELMLLVLLGSWVRGGVADINGKYTPKMDEIEDYLAEQAQEAGLDYLIEDFEGKIMSCETLSKQCEKIIEEYNDDEFWIQLERRLGQRDFYRTITDEEKREMKENNGWFPERIHKIYKKYEDEFIKNGVDGLEVKELKKSVLRKAFPEEL